MKGGQGCMNVPLSSSEAYEDSFFNLGRMKDVHTYSRRMRSGIGRMKLQSRSMKLQPSLQEVQRISKGGPKSMNMC